LSPFVDTPASLLRWSRQRPAAEHQTSSGIRQGTRVPRDRPV